MKTYLFLTICLALFVMSCKSSDTEYMEDQSPTYAKGVIIDASNGEPIPHAMVWLALDIPGSTSAGGSAMEYVEADEKGAFYFKFNALDDYSYVIHAEAPNYFGMPRNNKIVSGTYNEDMRVEILPKGFIRFKLVNEAPFDTIAKLSLPNVPGELSGLSKDTVIYSFEQGNLNKQLKWSLQRANEKNVRMYKENVFVPALDTVEMVIRY